MKRKVLMNCLALVLGGALFMGSTITSSAASASSAPTAATHSSENHRRVTGARQMRAQALALGSSPSANYEEGTNLSDEIVRTSPVDKVLLVVSFGTSFNQSRELTIGGIEAAMQTAFPDYQVRRAFTSQIIIDKLAEREGIRIDDIDRAMQRLVLDQIKEVIIQPTTVMPGYEYDDVMEAIMPYVGKFEKFSVSKPLLIDDSDFDAVADLVVKETEQYNNDGTAVVLMGHGTHHEANATYAKLEEVFHSKGYENYLIGTVEGGTLIDDILKTLSGMDVTKVVMRPLMIVAGDHANNDMAGDEEDSWKTILSNAGYEVETVIEGLGQVEGIQNLLAEHAKAAEIIEAPASTEDEADDTVSTGTIANGTYVIDAETDSSMFRVEACELTVKGDEMYVVITLGGTGFSKVFMGTAEEAAAASDESISNFVKNGDKYLFTVPVSSLDAELPITGFSASREQWYDHTVMFKSDKIPVGASVPADRQINITMTGGTGRTTIQSPARLTVVNGVDHAEIIWSSSNYIYMMVDGEKYLPVNEGGDSAFIIPIKLDTDMSVIGCTAAMSAPKEIEYTLRFDSATIK